MALTKGFVRTAGTDAIDARMMDAAKFVRTNTGAVRTGVLWTSATSGNVVGSTSNMNVNVVTADFVLSRGQTDGAVILSNSGAASVLLDVAPSANSRIDVVWAKQNDSEKGDADSQPVLGRTTGVAAASPTKPAIPTGALELATVLVPAGVSATNASGVQITNTFQWTSLAGGPLRYRSESAMRADTSVPAGISAYISDGGLFYRRANYWVREDGAPHAVCAGQSGSLASSSDMSTLSSTMGGTVSAYTSSDETVFPTRSDGVFGPISIAGRYEVSAIIKFAASSSGDRSFAVALNDTQAAPDVYGPGTTRGYSYGTMITAAVGDYIKFKGSQNSGSPVSYQWRFSVKLIQAA